MQLGKISTSSGSYLFPFASPHHHTYSVATLIMLLTLEFVVSASALMALKCLLRTQLKSATFDLG